MRLIYAAALMLSFATTYAQTIEFELDLTNPYLTLELLQDKTLDNEKLAEFFNLPTTPKLLRKLDIDSVTLVNALVKAREGKSPSGREIRLQYDLIVEQLDSISIFISEIAEKALQLEQDLQTSLGQFFPSDTTQTIYIRAMLGGWATGYTFGDAEEFFISLQKLNLDYNTLYAFSEHELFHNAQGANIDLNPLGERLDSIGLNGDLNVLKLLALLWQEGSASYVSNQEKYEQTPGLVASFQKFRENEDKMYAAYYLFDRLTVDSYHNPDADMNRIIAAFFKYEWGEIGYYIGYQMLTRLFELLNESERTEALQEYLGSYPTKFVIDYIDLTKQEDNHYYQFSNEFESIVRRLALIVAE